MSDHDHSTTDQFDGVLTSTTTCRITTGTALPVFERNKFYFHRMAQVFRVEGAQQLNRMPIAKPVTLLKPSGSPVSPLGPTSHLQFVKIQNMRFTHITLYSMCFY